jgi:hypothetical protein
MRVTTQPREPEVRLTLEDQGRSNKVALIASWEHEDETVYQVLMYFEVDGANITPKTLKLNMAYNPPFPLDTHGHLVLGFDATGQ